MIVLDLGALSSLQKGNLPLIYFPSNLSPLDLLILSCYVMQPQDRNELGLVALEESLFRDA